MSADQETLAVYAARAADYGAKFSRSMPPRVLREFMVLLPDGALVLDLGCGHGGSARFMAEAGFKVEAWDASAEMLDLLAPHDNITKRQAEFEDVEGVSIYDGVWCNFSLLHAPREEMPTHLAAISTALKTGGVFHLGLKTGAGSKRDQLGRFYTYYGLGELQGLLAEAGFEILSIEEGEEAGLAGPVEPFVILKARKNG